MKRYIKINCFLWAGDMLTVFKQLESATFVTPVKCGNFVYAFLLQVIIILSYRMTIKLWLHQKG